MRHIDFSKHKEQILSFFLNGCHCIGRISPGHGPGKKWVYDSFWLKYNGNNPVEWVRVKNQFAVFNKGLSTMIRHADAEEKRKYLAFMEYEQ